MRRRTLAVLRSLELVSALASVERLIADEDPAVRAEAIRTFTALTGADATHLLASKLHDADPRVRGAAVVGVLQLSSDDAASRAALDALDDLLTDADPAVRQQGAQTLGGAPSGPPPPGMGQPLTNRMLRLLSDPDPEVLRAAVRAVRRWNERDGTNFLFVPILISLLRERRLKHDVREALIACGEEALPLLVHFLRDRDEHFWVRLALPKTIARFRAEPARDALLGALPADDTALEHAIIASLSSLRAREPKLRFPVETVEELVREQARRYLRALGETRRAGRSRGDFQARGTARAVARAAAAAPARGAVDRSLERSRRQHLRPVVAGASPSRDLAGVRAAEERRRAHAQPRPRVRRQHAAAGRAPAGDDRDRRPGARRAARRRPAPCSTSPPAAGASRPCAA